MAALEARPARQLAGRGHALAGQLAELSLVRALQFVLLVARQVDLPAAGVGCAGEQLVLEVLAHATVVLDS